MIFTNKDGLKEKYGKLYGKFNEIKNSNSKIKSVEELVKEICGKNNIPTHLPSGKMRWDVWSKIAEMLYDMGIWLEPNPDIVDIGGAEEEMRGVEYPELPEWKDIDIDEKIEILNDKPSIFVEPTNQKLDGIEYDIEYVPIPKLDDIEYTPIEKVESTIDTSNLNEEFKKQSFDAPNLEKSNDKLEYEYEYEYEKIEMEK